MAAMIVLAAIRARDRIPTCLADDWIDRYSNSGRSSPLLVRKLVDRGEIDPYNYARTEIWRSSLNVIARNPILRHRVQDNTFIYRSAIRCRSKEQWRAI